MTRRQGIRVGLFTLLLAVILWIVGSVIGMPKDADVVLMSRRFEALYTDEKDTAMDERMDAVEAATKNFATEAEIAALWQ